MLRNTIFYILIFVLLVLLSACGLEVGDSTLIPDTPLPLTAFPTAVPGPEIEYCDDIPPTTVEGFPIINENFCLNNPKTDEKEDKGIQQDSFDGYDSYSVALDGAGRGPLIPGSTARHTYMQAFPGYLEIFIQGSAGQWGLSQSVQLDSGCHMLKLSGDSDINDRYHPYNYHLAASVYYPANEALLMIGKHNIPLHGPIKRIFIFWVDAPQLVQINGFFIALYGDAGENSTVGFTGFQLLPVPPGFCGRT